MPSSRLYPNQLPQQLTRGLQNGYLVFGEEPLQRFEAVAQIVQAAKQQGYLEVERLYLDSGDDVAQLADALQGMSLFASQRCVVLDLGNGKIGKEMAALLQHYAENPSPDVILICHGEKLDKAQKNSKWFKQLAGWCCEVSITQLSGDRLSNWLRQRATEHGVQLEPHALSLLQQHHEGNLLALSQELEKLALLYPEQRISSSQLQQSLVDQSKFNVFQLIDTLLTNDVSQVNHMLQQLHDEGLEPVIVSWALSREIAQLNALKQHPEQQSQLFKKFRIWPSRQPLIKQKIQQLSEQQLQQALQICALLERQIKSYGQPPELSSTTTTTYATTIHTTTTVGTNH